MVWRAYKRGVAKASRDSVQVINRNSFASSSQPSGYLVVGDIPVASLVGVAVSAGVIVHWCAIAT